MKNKKIKIISSLATIAILISAILTYHYLSQDEDDKYMTIEEYYESPFFKNRDDNEYLGETFYIKDKVEKVEVFRLAKTVITEEEGNRSVELSQPFEILEYTKVHFESDEKLFYYFMGNRTERFYIGETVSFNDTIKKYFTLYEGDLQLTESMRIGELIGEYFYLISLGKFSPVNPTYEWIDNKTYRITINEVLELPPLPINWKNLIVRKYDLDGKVILGNDDTLKIYDKDGKFLSEFKTDGKSPNLDCKLKQGQTIEILFDSKPENITVRFYEDDERYGMTEFFEDVRF